MSAPVTLTEQMDGLIAAHGLSSLSITRIDGQIGKFWAISAQSAGRSGAADYGTEVLSDAIAEAINELNKKRVAAVIVPELVSA